MWPFFCSGYVASAGPTSSTRVARSSHFWPCAGDATSFPSTTADAPVVSWMSMFRAGRAGIHDHLHVGEAGAVVQFEEGEALRVAPGADPAFDGHRFLRFGSGQDVFNQCAHVSDLAASISP